MRIAYIAVGVEKKNMAGGVGRKMQSQLGIWTDLGHAALLFSLVPEYQGTGVYTYGADSQMPGLREASRAISRGRALGRLIADVREFRADVIYLRCGSYVHPLSRLLSVAPVIMELNSNDIGETKLRGPYFYWMNRLTRGILLRNASGLVAVTREIAEMPENRQYGKPTRVIGNGIDLREYQPLPAPKNGHPVITLVGSAGQAWHGVDKLVALAQKCGDLKMNIVGYERADICGAVPDNVELHGFMDADGVRGVLSSSDVACGSLALHRNNMQEGSSLKVREALAYGIPVILGCWDQDLSDLGSECVLELPNSEDNVLTHAEDIRKFSRGMMGRRIARPVIAGRIDQRPKEETRLAFFAEVYGAAQHGKR